jgi:hypothetical protein
MNMRRDDFDRSGDDAFENPDKRRVSPALIGIGVLVAVIAIFVLQNRERTSLDGLFVEVQSRVWVALAIAVGLGVLLDRVVSTWWRRRKRRKTDL